MLEAEKENSKETMQENQRIQKTCVEQKEITKERNNRPQVILFYCIYLHNPQSEGGSHS